MYLFTSEAGQEPTGVNSPLVTTLKEALTIAISKTMLDTYLDIQCTLTTKFLADKISDKRLRRKYFRTNSDHSFQ